jgi:UDP-N-acetyl-D-glucosamine dehydrogenase
MRRYNFKMNSVQASSENIKTYDCIVVGTDHADFDYKMIRENAKLIVDTRGIYRGKYKNVVNA